MRDSMRRAGFTLVELLVVIAIIGILVALLLPAVQAAREAARRTQCKNQLRQIALSCMLHEDTQGHLPSGGWGDRWLADPTRGYGEEQPGSWVYSVFSFLENNALRDLGRGAAVGSADWQNAMRQLITTPVGTFNCPSRRSAELYGTSLSGLATDFGFLSGTQAVAKTDYAANAGDSYQNTTTAPTATNNFASPTNYAALNLPFPPEKFSDVNNPNLPFRFQSGVIHFRSEIKFSQIPDGTSKTYLIGEKYLSPAGYQDSRDLNSFAGRAELGDNKSMYIGFEEDTMRLAHAGTNSDNSPRPSTQMTAPNDPQSYQPSADADTPDSEVLSNRNLVAFGSAHPGGMNMAFCDGSVQLINYDIDRFAHRWNANRLDGFAEGQVIDDGF